MAAGPHSFSLDLSDLNTLHGLVALTVPPGSRVLDVRVADGSLARLLSQRGCTVTGVDPHDARASGAGAYCERVIVGDVESAETRAQLSGQTFDAVLCLGALEYAANPRALLEWSRQILRPGGHVIVALPNVTHSAIRLALLRGQSPFGASAGEAREPRRHFDRKGAEALLRAAGLRIDDRLRVTQPIDERDVSLDLAAVARQVVDALARDRDATTEHFVFVASPAMSTDRGEQPSLAEHLQTAVEDLKSANQRLDLRNRSLQQEVDARNRAVAELERRVSDLMARQAALEAQLRERMEELHQRHREVRYLQADMVVRDAFVAQLREEAMARGGEVDALRADVDRARAEVTDAAARASGYMAERDAARADAQHAAAQAAELARQAADYGRERDSARRELAERTSQLAIEALSERERSRASVTAARLEAAEAQDALARSRVELQALRSYCNSAGFRLVDRASVALRRTPRLYVFLRGLVRRVAGDAPTAEDRTP
jgi:2-polyprenyl-3-methyl-5-hydroxy-6-metoxy-1,4-benzoquinol methylase